MRFEWDPKKDALNQEKHGVSFTEAMSAFDDTAAAIFDDPKHSLAEKREIIIGSSLAERILLISFTQRAPELIRIISARKINRKERLRYEGFKKR
jgi:uncharacterized DUF497 family protein